MIETVFALLLIWDHEIKEHRNPAHPQPNVLRPSVYAMRDKKPADRVVYINASSLRPTPKYIWGKRKYFL